MTNVYETMIKLFDIGVSANKNQPAPFLTSFKGLKKIFYNDGKYKKEMPLFGFR
jgi:hypothetical protein